MVLWVFGYGSLVWRTGFTYDERVVGYIKGYKRVFHQGSTDHRGTPESPGRTVTLKLEEGSICWGAAYRVSGHDAEQLTLSYLNVRERQYDVRDYINFYTEDSSAEPAISAVLVYIATADKSKNRTYLGPAPMDVMASQIAKAVGPSGTNYEYLFRLEESLLEIGYCDEEIVALSNEVRKLLGGYSSVGHMKGHGCKDGAFPNGTSFKNGVKSDIMKNRMLGNGVHKSTVPSS
eukprot:TRINITY_DN11733_c0_g1_i2.p1 TRINITY_DN11733_c0_g1~~TRINITY_DN11733_c0_g1_i2.p1  ORF type:complete len:233 (-),score=18.26 TRINITY_DN11733_c0_g1_i2:412-1110(-)